MSETRAQRGLRAITRTTGPRRAPRISGSPIRPDEDIAVEVAEVLIEAGASSSAADPRLVTVLHQAVLAGKARILDLFLRKDPGAKQALDFPIVYQGSSTFPVCSAVAKGGYAELLTLLAYGAKINPTGSDVLKAKAIRSATFFLVPFYCVLICCEVRIQIQ
jgi:hypothetical protein